MKRLMILFVMTLLVISSVTIAYSQQTIMTLKEQMIEIENQNLLYSLANEDLENEIDKLEETISKQEDKIVDLESK